MFIRRFALALDRTAPLRVLDNNSGQAFALCASDIDRLDVRV